MTAHLGKYFLLLVIVFISSNAFSDGLRFTETSITENGHLNSLEDISLQTQGYGLNYIFSNGVGTGITSLTTQSKDQQVKMEHNYLDLNYSFGDSFRGVVGYSYGITGSISINGDSDKQYRSSAYQIGAGYRYGLFEIMWINRLNYPRYHLERPYSLVSTHYQLGLAFFWK